MAEPLTVMAVHAHPDDEAVATGGSLARYADEGVNTVVVTCTNGEFGDAPGGIKPGEEGHDPAGVVAIRRAELQESCRVLGVAHLEMLGYHDSGMADWPYRESPEAFCNVAVEVVAQRLVELMQRYRPQVVITYEEESLYDHPDHIQTSRATKAAVAQLSRVPKLYFTAMTLKGWDKIKDSLAEQGVETPDLPEMTPEMLEAMARTEARITTTVDVAAYLDRKEASLHAHASQFANSFFTKLPRDIMVKAFGQESYIRALDHTGAPLPETDLLAGLR